MWRSRTLSNVRELFLKGWVLPFMAHIYVTATRFSASTSLQTSRGSGTRNDWRLSPRIAISASAQTDRPDNCGMNVSQDAPGAGVPVRCTIHVFGRHGRVGNRASREVAERLLKRFSTGISNTGHFSTKKKPSSDFSNQLRAPLGIFTCPPSRPRRHALCM